MPASRSVVLNGRTITIDDAARRRIVEEMPEILWIGDQALRDGVTDAWAAAIASSSLARIGDMKPSGNYDSKPLASGTQADHMRSVTRMALKIAEEFAALFPAFTYDRDILIAGCLCHDIGKVWEFDPENVKRWKADPRKVGMPSLRHPGYGIHICLTMGLPEAVAHMAAAHSGEGELLVRSKENTILHWADYTFWRVVEAGGLFAETDPWLDQA
ncbi:MAG: HD domain-containing protein [Acetobacteraceae bacterium]|nr:HD domain-containing protein [Acetobacteraceae bacterium]